MRVRAAWDNLGFFMSALKFTRERLMAEAAASPAASAHTLETD